MSIVNISASKSLTVSNNHAFSSIKKELLVVGKYKKACYYSYIFFDISPHLNCTSLLSAKLVLFKIANFININSVNFSVYPLCDYFSSFTTFKNPCKIDPILKHNFKPIPYISFTKI